MLTLKSFAAVAVVLGLAQAAPSSAAVPRDITLLLLCNDANLGDCLDFQTEIDLCKNIPDGFDNSVSSVNTFSDFKLCNFYNNPDCNEDAGSITLGGVQNTLSAEFDDNFSSVKCLRNK
ncbi:hypothetical protein JX266_005244 [Neoarthrinium moseri]|nr:hypothetical protein JX266_005244 [Neoarthrinium moseri]